MILSGIADFKNRMSSFLEVGGKGDALSGKLSGSPLAI